MSSGGAARRPVVVLVGPPGAGKTTVGRALAQRLGVPWRDTDADVEAVAGKPIPDIFIADGEERFRALERDAVAAALAGYGGVLALGGGAVLADQTRALLREHLVVYLSVELPDALARVGIAGSRPLLLLNPRATLRYLLDQRRPLYQEVARYTVATDGRTPDEVTADVLRLLAVPPPAGPAGPGDGTSG